MNIAEDNYVEARAFSEFITELALNIINRKATVSNVGDEIALDFYEKVYDSCVYSWYVAHSDTCGKDPVSYKIRWDESFETMSLVSRFLLQRKLKAYKVIVQRDMMKATKQTALDSASRAVFRGYSNFSPDLVSM